MSKDLLGHAYDKSIFRHFGPNVTTKTILRRIFMRIMEVMPPRSPSRRSAFWKASSRAVLWRSCWNGLLNIEVSYLIIGGLLKTSNRSTGSLLWSNAMRVVNAQPREGYRLEVAFDDGISGVVDMKDRLFGPVFEPLRDPTFFRRVSIDEFGAICWPNGADLAPDALYERIRSAAITQK